MQKLTSVLFLERPLAQYCDGELKGEHTDVASSLAATKVEQKHLKVIIRALASLKLPASLYHSLLGSRLLLLQLL